MNDIIFMIHGMWGGGWCWDDFRGFFQARGYRCVSPTLRFHDKDPDKPPDPQLGKMSIKDYAEDLEMEIGKLGSAPILMGHGMGGLLAQILSSRGLAKALVLLAPASPYGVLSVRPSMIKSFWRLFLKWGFWSRPFRQNFDEATYSLFHLLPPEKRKEIFQKTVYESGRAISEIGLWFFDLGRTSKVDALKVSCPLLMVAGSQDRVAQARVLKKTLNRYAPVATFKAFAHHAHWLIQEPGWEEIAEFISGWMSENLEKAPVPTQEKHKPKTPKNTTPVQSAAGDAWAYVAGKGSDVFHRRGCRSGERVILENLVGFDNKEDAIRSGKRACKRCMP